MRAILFGLCLGQVVCHAEIPTLRFDDKVTWKQVFDSGFRPKHLEGLEDHKCVCPNQSFWLQFKDREPKFKVENGRVAFSFYYDDFLSMIWHQGAEAITLKEGRERADEFRRTFDGFITQEISMPRQIDPSGLVDAGNDENNVKARVGEYLVYYGFDNSMRKDKPIIPHFYIAWSFPGQPEHRLKDVRDVVRPPAGYEWYSLDPKVDTPEPGSSPKVASETAEPAPKPEEIISESKKPKPTGETKPNRGNVALYWRIGLIVSAIVALFFVRGYFSRKGGNNQGVP